MADLPEATQPMAELRLKCRGQFRVNAPNRYVWRAHKETSSVMARTPTSCLGPRMPCHCEGLVRLHQPTSQKKPQVQTEFHMKISNI